jgi:hypothetical protein
LGLVMWVVGWEKAVMSYPLRCHQGRLGSCEFK